LRIFNPIEQNIYEIRNNNLKIHIDSVLASNPKGLGHKRALKIKQAVNP
jgi:hypothetical protein